ncbi:hypothetical protein HHK36_003854 [Tetracentron sinense]|uniref:Uncharacterized protein n=1 Tax=Tetracentron sinense TaxID=13715 RepID=A0A834ZZA8_TETSI|nr:hypothetical protein HHK36_003854 [Tetracentron sinense]
MAFSSGLTSASHFPKSPNKTQEFCFSNATYMSAANHGSINQSHNLVSKPSQDYMDLFGIEHKHELEEIKLIFGKVEDPLESLIMIDALQRLGIDYHFQEEIKRSLSRSYENFRTSGDGSLYEVALSFRLLRQDGYHVPADVFNNFKGKDGKFKLALCEDIRGMMGFYEASHLAVEGEHILDEAKDFAEKHFKVSMITLIDKDLARIVRNTLEHPFHKSLARFRTKYYIKSFQTQHEWIQILQDFAKMDFNIVQGLHQQELLHISKWWKDLGLAQEMKFARDQLLKWYLWPMAALTDPRFSEQRIELTKPISLIYIIDDIFDVYGKLDELVLFTEAINRWDIAAGEQLPNYMKICFKAVYEITNEIAYKVFREHGWNPTNSLRKTWVNLFNAFLVEAKWFASGNLPKAEEYLKNAVISSGVHVVLVHMFFLLGHGITKDSVDLVDDIPNLISLPATILRLWDDLGSAKDENQEGYDGSYIECYMKEHQDVSYGSAREQVFGMISDAWKRLNEECLSLNPFSSSFRKASLNVARMVPVMYNYDDNQCLPSLEEHITSMLYESIA